MDDQLQKCIKVHFYLLLAKSFFVSGFHSGVLSCNNASLNKLG